MSSVLLETIPMSGLTTKNIDLFPYRGFKHIVVRGGWTLAGGAAETHFIFYSDAVTQIGVDYETESKVDATAPTFSYHTSDILRYDCAGTTPGGVTNFSLTVSDFLTDDTLSSVNFESVSAGSGSNQQSFGTLSASGPIYRMEIVDPSANGFTADSYIYVYGYRG